ncbi:recombination regulator RecX [Nocardia sp. CNY236]|uniref:recombination regulator RecX n=1 Tax=Nocardia sp. CNY236 TaxID=1169152 RepID=UPI0004233202|nr:recombination regulator RecX [Nocardia sp. CNY236]
MHARWSPESSPSEPERSSKSAGSGATVEQAKQVCLRLLGLRAHSRAELAKRLAAKGYPPEVSEQALDRLTTVGLVDDAAFAEQWVHSRHHISGKGRQALAQELRRKGVAQSNIASALAAITTDDEESRATRLVQRKVRTLTGAQDRDKVFRRLVGMLVRRGYQQHMAYRVVEAALADRGDGGDTVAPID